MAVSARSARTAPQSARPQVGPVDMRSGGRTLAGSFFYEGDRRVIGWHSHDLHRIEYAINGIEGFGQYLETNTLSGPAPAA